MNAPNLTPVLQQIGERIRELRQGKKITQRRLAEKCGFEKASMSRIESGQVNMSVDTLLKIAEALETNIVNLLLINQN